MATYQVIPYWITATVRLKPDEAVSLLNPLPPRQVSIMNAAAMVLRESVGSTYWESTPNKNDSSQRKRVNRGLRIEGIRRVANGFEVDVQPAETGKSSVIEKRKSGEIVNRDYLDTELVPLRYLIVQPTEGVTNRALLLVESVGMTRGIATFESLLERSLRKYFPELTVRISPAGSEALTRAWLDKLPVKSYAIKQPSGKTQKHQAQTDQTGVEGLVEIRIKPKFRRARFGKSGDALGAIREAIASETKLDVGKLLEAEWQESVTLDVGSGKTRTVQMSAGNHIPTLSFPVELSGDGHPTTSELRAARIDAYEWFKGTYGLAPEYPITEMSDDTQYWTEIGSGHPWKAEWHDGCVDSPSREG